MLRTAGKHISALLALVAFAISTNGQVTRYLGCFYDYSHDRALPGLTSCPDFQPFCNNVCSAQYRYCQSDTNMSVSNCVHICSRLNFIYAGVQTETQCFCGDKSAMYAKHGREANEDFCMSNCSGDPSQSCGTALRMEVHEIGCLPFDVPLNATSPTLDNKDFFEVGENLNVSCQDGFFLTGPGELTCLPLGEWNHPPPSCLPDVCSPPEVPPGGTLRGNSSIINVGFRGGDKLEFDCDVTGAILNLTCIEGLWHMDGTCREIYSSAVPHTEQPATKVQSTEMEPTNGQTTKIHPTENQATVKQSTEIQTLQMTTFVTSSATNIVNTQRPNEVATTYEEPIIPTDEATETPWQEGMTTIAKYARTDPSTMLWLIIMLAVALALFLIVVSLAVIIGCKRKAKRHQPINFIGEVETPKVEDMSSLNFAYEDDGADRPNQNGHQTTTTVSRTGSPIRISTLYSQQEITVQNKNDSGYTYAKPVSPAYPTSQSGAVPNEYASPVHTAHHEANEGAVNGEAGTALYAPDIPKPDYDMATRDSYVELVTKL